MYPQALPDLEQRLSRLQAQLDRLSLTLQQWQQNQEHLEPMERRLAHLVQQSGEILDRIAVTDQRHFQAIAAVESRLNEWGPAEDRLQQNVFQRVRDLERTIENQWTALREQLSRDLHAVAEARGAGSPPALTSGTSWPLDSVLRLHDELRHSEDGSPITKGVPRLPATADALQSRIESLERAVTTGKEELTQTRDRGERQRKIWTVAVAALALVFITAGVLMVAAQRDMSERMRAATARVTAAEQQARTATELASQKVAETRENAEREIADARRSARTAQTVSDVLAAPDLVRFTLTTSGSTASRSYGQLLWSRSRGLVFSGSRVPAAPAGSNYQLWLLTNTQPVSAGLLEPDSAGRVNVVTEHPPEVPRPVTGASVTLEPGGGRAAPSGPILMERIPIESAAGVK
jgi:hypothetical protein